MTWDGNDRRQADDRRIVERRRTMRYNVQTLLVIDGITWVDPDGTDRRQHIRRLEDRVKLADKVIQYARP
jgi:hypothetical protein